MELNWTKHEAEGSSCWAPLMSWLISIDRLTMLCRYSIRNVANSGDVVGNARNEFAMTCSAIFCEILSTMKTIVNENISWKFWADIVKESPLKCSSNYFSSLDLGICPIGLLWSGMPWAGILIWYISNADHFLVDISTVYQWLRTQLFPLRNKRQLKFGDYVEH